MHAQPFDRQGFVEHTGTIPVTFPVDRQRVADTLCSAFEGGSTYWCRLEDKSPLPDAALETLADQNARAYLMDWALLGGSLTFSAEGGSIVEGGPTRWTLDADTLAAGLGVMATKYPTHFADMVSHGGDATTGDVLLQCCLFGEVVFG